MPNEGHIVIRQPSATMNDVGAGRFASADQSYAADTPTETAGADVGPCLVSEDPRANNLMRRLYEQSLKEERLDGSEEQARQVEKSILASRGQRWDGQARWQGRENEEARLVNIRHAHWFIRQLRKAGVDASVDDPFEWYRDQRIPVASWPRPATRVWLNAFVRAGRVGVSTWDPLENGPKTVTTLQWEYGPEYTIMRFNQYNVPTSERYRGWRTALLQLVYEGVLTEREAERAFGPALGPAGAFYREQLQRYREIHFYAVRKEDDDARA